MLNIRRFARIIIPIFTKAPRINIVSLEHKAVAFFSEHKKVEEQIQKSKEEAKQFYSNHVEDIMELQRIEDWQSIITSCSEVLLIDFYADWCKPCKVLTPLLEKKIKQSRGRIKLLKINIDKFGQIAQTFQIKSVPTVYMVYGGKAIDKFSGQVNEEQLDKFLETVGRVTQYNRQAEEVTLKLGQVQQLIKNSQFQEAEKILSGLKYSRVSEQFKFVGDIFLALSYSEQNKMTQLKAIIEIMKQNAIFYSEKPEFQGLFTNLCEKCEIYERQKSENNEVGQWSNKIKADPKNCELLFEASQFYRSNEMVEECLDTLLEIIRLDKNWEDKKANKAVLELLAQFGKDSPITKKYRRRLNIVLH